MTRPLDSASPVALVPDHDGSLTHPGAFFGDVCGLTKREYFAAIMHAALIGKAMSDYEPSGAAHDALKHADALIEELNQ